MYEMHQFGMDSGDLNFKNREIQENWKSSSKMTLAPMEFYNFLFFHLEWSYEHPGTGGKNAHQNSWSQFAYERSEAPGSRPMWRLRDLQNSVF